MNRRGSDIALTQAAMMILVIAVAIVIFAWYIGMHNAAQVKKDIEQCYRTTAMYGNSMIDTPGPDLHLFNRNCRRRIVTFTKDHVEVNGERLTFWDPVDKESSKKYKELTPEIVNSVVASELSICWYENLEGKEYLMNEVDLRNNDLVCIPCGEIRFEPVQGVRDAFTAKQQEVLFSYLQREKSQPYPGRSAVSYFDYFYNNGALCDHDPESRWNPARPLVRGTFYDKTDPRSCQEQFFDRIVTHPKVMKDIKITPDQAYYIMTYKLGTDKRTKDGQPWGTSYAPLAIPYSHLTSELCPRYLT